MVICVFILVVCTYLQGEVDLAGVTNGAATGRPTLPGLVLGTEEGAGDFQNVGNFYIMLTSLSNVGYITK